jgi:hypothetical protein
MGYYVDISKITIEDYQEKLKSSYLPPSRMILKEKLDERFDYFESIGIKNVKELVQLLKKKDKFTELSKVNCLSGDYLTILLRELNSTLPKPNKIADFSWISNSTIDKLAKAGIMNTEKLYDKIVTRIDRQKLANTTGIDYTEILQLTKLTDLSRIKWVGVTYARMLYDLGLDSVEKVAKADPVDLHVRINQRIKEYKIFKGGIGINDVKIVVETANELPLEIEY